MPRERNDVRGGNGEGRVALERTARQRRRRGRVVAADPKPARRVRDPDALRRLHQEGGECVLADDGGCVRGLSLHHVYPRGQGGDDVAENVVWLCGHGTTGHHGLIEAWDAETRAALGQALPAATIGYVLSRLGVEPGRAFLQRRYLLTVDEED